MCRFGNRALRLLLASSPGRYNRRPVQGEKILQL